MNPTCPAEKPFRFFNVMPFSPDNEKQVARDMIALRDRTGIDELLYSLTLHPEGRPAARKAEFLIESFRRLKAELRGSGIKTGVLIQSILGHWPRVDGDEEPWTRSVDILGNTPRYCPFDPDFRNYIFTTIAKLAAEHPSFLLGDDDIRMFSPHVECFCPLHTAEFNRTTGRNFTVEEYRRAVSESHPGDEIFTAFEALRQKTVNGLAELIREAIDSVDPAIPAGACMSGWECRFSGDIVRGIAGKNPGILRIANAMYLEGSPKSFPDNILHTQTLRLRYSGIGCVIDEADTFPHNLYSRSAQSMHAKLCSGIFSGLNGAKLWFVNAHKGPQPVSPKYTEILERYAGFYQTLAKEVAGTTPDGVVIPVHEHFIEWHPAGNVGENFYPQKTWVHEMLGQFGIPFRPSFNRNESGCVHALAGEKTVDRFRDEELAELLRNPVLIDGPAARKLTERGFSASLGVEATRRDFRFNHEFSAGNQEPLPVVKNADMPHLTAIDPAAEVLTELFYTPFAGSPVREKAAPGTVFYRNSTGGRIATTAFHGDVPLSVVNETRKRWLLDLLDRLNGAPLPYVCAEDQPVTLLHRSGTDTDLLLLFNLGFDLLESVALRCANRPSGVEMLTPEGHWQAVAGDWTAPLLKLPIRLECYGCAALRIFRDPR